MNLRNALKAFLGIGDTRAASNVTGAVLMIGITVVLGSMVGTFVTGFSDRVGHAQPSAQFNFEYGEDAGTANSIEITHDGGDGIAYKQIEVTIDGHSAWQYNASGGDNFGANLTGEDDEWTSKIVGGDKLTIEETGDDESVIEDGDTVKIIWTAEGTDKTAVIGESDVTI